ncbi:MAG: acetoacetate--CoA ligase, partial [Candidatus Dadabacteria bacterium]
MSSTSPKIMWKPSKELLLSSQIAQFINFISEEGVDDFHSLYNWSINQPELFWLKVWDFCGVIAKERGSVVLKSDGTMLNSQWFPEAELNFAENLLTPLASAKKLDEKVIIFWGEDKVKREVSLDELLSTVRKIWWLFKQEGLSKGDRVAAYIPNIPETVFFMLGVAANGGVWSSCSPDFGTEAVLDRFSQITPSFLITTDGYYFKGKVINIFDKVKEVIRRLPSLKKVIVIPYTGSVQEKDYPEKCISLNSWLDLAPSSESISISYTMVPFNSPLYIMYSSGTTGKPKCIVHGVGGTLLEHLKEHKLHTDISEKDVFFYQTSCGWMMWNWLVTGLASKAQLVLYDGYPLLNNNRILFELAESAGITVFGTNARYL